MSQAPQQGWAGMEQKEPTPAQKLEMELQQMQLAKAFRTVFESGQGPMVLQAILQHAYGQPRYEFGHPNFTELSFIRGGLHEGADFITSRINIAKQGEFNVGPEKVITPSET